ncbi:MAG: septum formation protein Maf [Bacteroidetes bacterium]|nr:septum formation protein Maf [Bacteroidota bacterium]MBM3424852.1 septum formation protein Maf [Bacteroidota bacterium]
MKLILGSNSPRRVELLTRMGYAFEQRVANINEKIDVTIPWYKVPEDISLRKMKALRKNLLEDELLICADTLVFIDKTPLSKPTHIEEARTMLQILSDRKHEVITGVCLATLHTYNTFYERTTVEFRSLEKSEITQYLTRENALDRAGAYGIQDWIGLIGIRTIKGSYTNVMGLPTERLYLELKKFTQ